MIELSENKVKKYLQEIHYERITKIHEKARPILSFIGFEGFHEDCKLDFQYKGYEFTLDYDFDASNLELAEMYSCSNGICLVNLKVPFYKKKYRSVWNERSLIAALEEMVKYYDSKRK